MVRILKNEGVEIVQDPENRLTVIKMLHKPEAEVHTSQHRTEKQIQCGRGGEEDPRKVMNKAQSALLRQLHCAASWYRYSSGFPPDRRSQLRRSAFSGYGRIRFQGEPSRELFPLVRGFDEIFGAMPVRPDDRPSTAASEPHLFQVSPPGLRPVPRLSWVGGLCPLRNLCTGIPLCSAAWDKYPLPSFVI